MLKKTAAAGLALSLVVLGGLPSEAANKTVKVGTVATVSYPTSVKLKNSGCQTIPVKFKSANGSKIFAAGAGFQDAYGNDAGGGEFSTDGENAKSAFTVNAKVCRKSWTNSDDLSFVGVQKGKYGLIFMVLDDSMDSGQLKVNVTFN